MCTLIAIHRAAPGVPLVVAANRDEYLDRPAEGPAIRAFERSTGASAAVRPVLAPRDVRAGGTWLGLSAGGVFAALTNRPDPKPDRSRRSRGWIVTRALAAATAKEAAKELAALPSGEFNPFNAFVADGSDAFAVVYEDKPEPRRLEPGAHVIGNADPDDRRVPKVARVLGQAEHAASLLATGLGGASKDRKSRQQATREEVLEALARACRQHDTGDGPLGDTCLHLGESSETHGLAGAYGTRSSTLLWLANDPRQRRLLHADGPPCRHDYRDMSFLLDELSQATSYVQRERTMREVT